MGFHSLDRFVSTRLDLFNGIPFGAYVQKLGQTEKQKQLKVIISLGLTL